MPLRQLVRPRPSTAKSLEVPCDGERSSSDDGSGSSPAGLHNSFTPGAAAFRPPEQASPRLPATEAVALASTGYMDSRGHISYLHNQHRRPRRRERARNARYRHNNVLTAQQQYQMQCVQQAKERQQETVLEEQRRRERDAKRDAAAPSDSSDPFKAFLTAEYSTAKYALT